MKKIFWGAFYMLTGILCLCLFAVLNLLWDFTAEAHSKAEDSGSTLEYTHQRIRQVEEKIYDLGEKIEARDKAKTG